ncbi:hypothetical protein FB451DRAFT_1168684 [Mycena latifolia]|nr:hypothetical protein FB451DRAFT_1168684 [Mycena latifolia]
MPSDPKTTSQNSGPKDTPTTDGEHPVTAPVADAAHSTTDADNIEAAAESKSPKEGTDLESTETRSAYFPDPEEIEWIKPPSPPGGTPRGAPMKPTSGYPPPPPRPKDPPPRSE